MENQNTEEIIIDDMLQMCYTIIDTQEEAISKGRITHALKCQEQLKKYIKKLNEIDCKEVINYKREKFAELLQTREQVEEQVKTWKNTMRGMYRVEHAGKRKQTMEQIQKLQNKEKETQKQDENEMLNELA